MLCYKTHISGCISFTVQKQECEESEKEDKEQCSSQCVGLAVKVASAKDSTKMLRRFWNDVMRQIWQAFIDYEPKRNGKYYMVGTTMPNARLLAIYMCGNGCAVLGSRRGVEGNDGKSTTRCTRRSWRLPRRDCSVRFEIVKNLYWDWILADRDLLCSSNAKDAMIGGWDRLQTNADYHLCSERSSQLERHGFRQMRRISLDL